ncbi:regulatory protein RecX [bacterium]|nr:regulatory protein RecX [bacterium]
MAQWSKEQESTFWNRALSLLEIREHSRQELSKKLLARGCPRSLSSFLVERCVEHNFINEERYALRFAKLKMESGWGERRIRCELRRRGLSEELISKVCLLFEFDEVKDSQEALAFELAVKKAKQGRNFASVCRFLAGRGFPSEVVLAAAKKAFADVCLE